MKRIKRFIYIFIMIFILFPSVISAATELSASTQNPIVGEYIWIQLEANYGDLLRIRDFHVNIDYDTKYFELESIEDIKWIKTKREMGTVKHTPGRISVDKVNGNWDSGPIVQIKFKVKRSGSTTIKLARSDKSYYTNGDEIAQTMAGMIINPKEPSTNTILNSLSVKGYSISPPFSSNNFKYNLKVPSDVTSVIIEAKKGDTNQTLNGVGTKKLEYGDNKARIVVTAQNGDTRTYEIMINRHDDRKGIATLQSLSVSNTNIELEENKTVYEALVSRSVDQVLITGRTTDVNATMTGTGKKKLEIGENIFEIKVSSSKGEEKIYTIKITRSPEEIVEVGKSTRLKSLKVNGLMFDVSEGKTNYLYSINSKVDKLNIQALAESPTATLEIKGNEKLISGINLISIIIKEKSISEETEYKLVVFKNPEGTKIISNISEIESGTNYIVQNTKDGKHILSRDKIQLLNRNKNTLYYNVVNLYSGLLYQIKLPTELPEQNINLAITKLDTGMPTYNMELPANSKVTLHLDYYYPDGTNLKIYSYDELNNYTQVTAGIQVINGYITFETNGQKNYVITTTPLIEEQSPMQKLFSKYKTIILGTILGLVALVLTMIIINKKQQEKENEGPLY